MQNTDCQYCTYLHIISTTTLSFSQVTHIPAYILYIKLEKLFERGVGRFYYETTQGPQFPCIWNFQKTLYILLLIYTEYYVHFNTHAQKSTDCTLLDLLFGQEYSFVYMYRNTSVQSRLTNSIYQLFNIFTFKYTYSIYFPKFHYLFSVCSFYYLLFMLCTFYYGVMQQDIITDRKSVV